jgi:uncharacterized lipoprotein YbaY
VELRLNIIGHSGEALPAGSPVKVEIRDTSVADAPALVLHQLRTVVPPAAGSAGLPVTLELTSPVPDGATVWVHIDTDRDGRVSKGDLITMESYPVRAVASQTLTVKVKKVG